MLSGSIPDNIPANSPLVVLSLLNNTLTGRHAASTYVMNRLC